MAHNPLYPEKTELALELLAEFCAFFPDFTVQSIHADAWFGTQRFMDQASALFDGVQTVSQLHSNQKIWFRGLEWTLNEYFKAYSATSQTLVVRGDKKQTVIYGSARLALLTRSKKTLCYRPQI